MNRAMETGLDDIKEMVDGLLKAAGIAHPPVDPFHIVQAFHQRAYKVKLPDNLKGYTRKIGSLHEIYVNADQRSERQNFALAHEIFELILPDQPYKERLCNLGASNLLMPYRWFKEACQTTSFNLVSLKKTFSTASWEAIAYRTLAFREGVVSIVDNGRVTNRVGSMGHSYPPDLTHPERLALRQTMDTGETTTMEQGGMTVEAYPVFEEGWRRVILVAQPSFRAGR